jgi:hypothetical protein
MFVVRLTAVLVLIAIALTFVLYAATRDRRYLRWSWRIFQFALVFVVALMVLYLVERVVFVV